MQPFVIGLVLVSTFMHAGWNLLARRHRAEQAFFTRMLFIVAVVGLVPALASEWMVRSLSPLAWICVLGSGLCCGGYYYSLAKAYASSDFTIVYPVARALPVLLIGIGDVARGNYPTAVGWFGMMLVVAGCLLVPLRTFRDISLSRYYNRSILWMVLTALGTVGYTMFDKVASESVRQGPASAARYGYIFFALTYLAYLALQRGPRITAEQSRRMGWLAPAIAAVLNFSAYWLVLWAYQLTMRASYVVAFRQFSIVIGVVLAFILYKESGRAVRITGTLLLTAGLVVIGLWGR